VHPLAERASLAVITRMAQIWSEPFDKTKHQNQMDGVESSTADHRRAPTLLPRQVYFVRVCSFTFQFHSIQQIQACLDYYDRKIQPSSRLDIGAADHWECQRWFERLPLFLREESERQRVVKALRGALKKFEK
jgi:hypothetical protein